MRFDIVPINRIYSGIDRSLVPDNFLTPETKPYYDTLLDIYFSYLDLMCNPFESLAYDENLFCVLQHFYREFCAYNVSCELIVFDTIPIDYAYGFSIEFLGIDIVLDMAESLISCNHQADSSIRKCLNEMGLFDNLVDANNAINLLSIHNAGWKPCWVYKVNL